MLVNILLNAIDMSFANTKVMKKIKRNFVPEPDCKRPLCSVCANFIHQKFNPKMNHQYLKMSTSFEIRLWLKSQNVNEYNNSSSLKKLAHMFLKTRQ